MGKNCDKKGDLRKGNMTESMKKGVKDLKDGGGIVMATDKTGGLSYETEESYKKAAEDHIGEDEDITEKVRKNTESNFNGIGKALLRCLRVGETNKKDDRFIQAITTSNTILPPMSLAGKDHKPIEDPTKGPKRRAIVSANEGPNVRVSNLVASVLKQVSDMEDSDKEERATEGLQAKIEDLNRRLHEDAYNDDTPKDDRCLVAGSLDFKSMYPSFEAGATAKIVRRRVEEGPAVIEVDEVELSRTLFIALSDDEIEVEDIKDLLHTVKEGEDKPRMTDQEITGGSDFRTVKSKLNPPKRSPTPREKKKADWNPDGLAGEICYEQFPLHIWRKR